MDFSPDREIEKLSPLVDEFFQHVLYDEEPLFVSDEATVWDVSMSDADELIRRCSAHYHRAVSHSDLDQPLWKLITLLNGGR